MTKKERDIRRRCFFGAVAIMLSYGAVGIAESKNKADFDSVKYSVQSDDTLWDIAAEHVPEDMDIREYVAVLKAINGVTDTIHPGTSLIVPIYSERGNG